MALVVGVDTYVTVAELTAYASARAITIVNDEELILLKAMDYIETRSYSGTKTDELQDLEHPRNGETEVPQKIKTAQVVAAILIDSGENLFPASTQAIKREKIDVIEIEYQDNSTAFTSYSQLNALISPFLNSIGGSFMVTRV